MIAIAVGCAGSLGAVLRYVTDVIVQSRRRGSFPVGTLVVNLAGSLVFGIVAGYALNHSATAMHDIIAAGFCGGLTTWSTASWELVRLYQEGLRSVAAAYLALSVAGSLAAAGVGIAIG